MIDRGAFSSFCPHFAHICTNGRLAGRTIVVRMGKMTAAALMLVAAMMMTGCTSDPEPAPTVTSQGAEPTQDVTPTPKPSEVVAAGPPAECVEYVVDPPIAHAQGGAEIAAAAALAALPDDVILNPGVQTISSVDEPGMIEAVARVCSEPMDEAELVDIASAIAVAIKANPSSETLAVLVVSAWSPGADGHLEQGETVTTDFQLYTWDASTSAVPLSNNWD